MLQKSSKNARFLSRMGAQGTYGQAIFDLAEDNTDFFAVSADLGIASGLDRFIKKYENEHKINNDYDFYYFMKCLIKFMCGKLDAHTNLSMKNNNNHYPISFLTIDNKIYIHKCNEHKYNLSELKEINGIKIEKIIDELERCTNYGTYSWFLVKLDFGLSEKNTLLSLPSINSNTNTIEYKTSKGIIKYDINKDYTQDFSIFNIDKFEQLKIKDNMLIIKYPSCSSIYAPNIKDIKRKLGENYELIELNSESIKNLKNIKFDEIIYNKDINLTEEEYKFMREIINKTKYILINSDEKIKIPENILIKIITFGFNSKSTIMISSVKENYIIISVQREIEKLNGDIIENQEKKIEIEQNKKSSIYNEIINFLIKEL